MIVRRALGIALLGVSALVFLIRIQHPGPYWMPEQGNLRAALAAGALGLWFVVDGLPEHPARRILDLVLALATPVVLFFATYAILAEVEEVVVLEPPAHASAPAPLRLWIMDADGAEWVNMGRVKATASGLVEAGVDVTLWRHGEPLCRRAFRVDDRATVERINRLGSEKYAVKRLAVAIGLFPTEASPDSVSVRLEPCGLGARPATGGLGDLAVKR